MLTRKPRKMNRIPRNSPTKKALVLPNRFAPLVMAGMIAPMAMRIVAGTLLERRPATSAATAPGNDATKFTTIAIGTSSRLPIRVGSPWSRRSE